MISLFNVGRVLMVLWIMYGLLLIFAPGVLHHAPDQTGGAIQVAVAFGLGYLMDRGISAVHRRRAMREHVGISAEPAVGTNEIESPSPSNRDLNQRSWILIGVAAAATAAIAVSAYFLPPLLAFYKTAAPAAPQVETATAVNGGDLLEAFLAAFSQPAPYRAIIPATDDSRAHALDFSPLAFINVAPNVVALVSKGEGRDTEYSCHACSGAMTMHYMKRGPQGFTVLGHWPIVSGGASYGDVNPWSIRTDLDDVPTMLISETSSGMGCVHQTDTLVALTPTGPEERGSFTHSSSYQEDVDVKNGSKDYSYEGKVIAIERGKRFAIEYSGEILRRIEFVKGNDRVYRSGNDDYGQFPPTC